MECMIAIYDVIYAEYFRELSYRNKRKAEDSVGMLGGEGNWIYKGFV